MVFLLQQSKGVETGGELPEIMTLAPVNTMAHEYGYMGSGKQMWEES